MSAPNQAPSRLLQTLAVALLVGWLVLGARVTATLSTGGRGTLAILDPALILLGVAIWCCTPTGRGKIVPARMYWRSAGPLFLLLLLLPVLGVAHGTHNVRSLYSIALVAVPWSIFMVGRVAGDPRTWTRGVTVAIWIHGAYGAAQLMGRLSLLPDALSGWMAAWDLSSQAAYAESYIVSQRSTGVLINPNSYGLWSVLAVVFSVFYLRGRTRAISIALALTGVYASESRTAMAALVVSLIVVALTGRGLDAILKMVALVAAAAVPLAVLNWFGMLQSFFSESTLERMRSGWLVLTGRGVDENLAGRFEAWDLARTMSADHWLGTWGPPQVTLGQSIDSQYLALFLQGSLPLLLAYLLLLISPLIVLPKRRRRPFVALSVAVATMSLTATAFENMAAMGLVWCALVIDALRLRAYGDETVRSEVAEVSHDKVAAA
ncbi:O-antigen ligase family protein [Nocardioides ganghwensis]|uniref:O-antigen ligase family protein n=1 Tax=Nocardioides ganghwensis TaxID=252230 RepID=UPI0013ECE32C|nr:O-antigen ligase family protein [Nocardioides ganghwensis]MBD3947186.1 O-antigen ligase family protein [Nocardioides ganghwensis]